MDQSCKSIPVLDYQGFDLIEDSADCNAFSTGRKLYDEVARSTVLVETGTTASPRPRESAKVGTGFFVNKGDEIVTNGHVGAIDPYVDIITNDGKMYHAKLEKLDDENDLALLKVIGIDQNPDRALKPIASTDLKKTDEIEVFGRPDGYDSPVLSSGYFIGKNSLINLVADPGSFSDLAPLIKLRQETTDPSLYRDISEYLDSDRLHVRMNIHHGDSGSPAVNANGELVGVAADRVSGADALIIPADKLQKLLSTPESKFNFEYETDANQNQHLLTITRKDGSNLPPIILEAK